MEENVVRDKSFTFALKIIKTYKALQMEEREFLLSKQLMKSGTAIGALISESEHAQSKADFISELSIALKEANETTYRIRLLKESGFLGEEAAEILKRDCDELTRILASIVKTSKEN